MANMTTNGAPSPPTKKSSSSVAGLLVSLLAVVAHADPAAAIEHRRGGKDDEGGSSNLVRRGGGGGRKLHPFGWHAEPHPPVGDSWKASSKDDAWESSSPDHRDPWKATTPPPPGWWGEGSRASRSVKSGKSKGSKTSKGSKSSSTWSSSSSSSSSRSGGWWPNPDLKPSSKPSGGSPTTLNPTTASPTPGGTTSNPTTRNPTSTNPTTRNPTTTNPTTAGPTLPTTSSPVTPGPTTPQGTPPPTTANPATPATPNPTTAIPATPNPTTGGPTQPTPADGLVPSATCGDFVLDGTVIGPYTCLQNADYGVVDDSRYRIDMLLQVLPGSDPASYEAARLRWMEVIVGDLPNVPSVQIGDSIDGSCINDLPPIVDDLFLCVRERAIDGEGGILGQAGPLFRRTGPLSNTAITGRVAIDYQDVAGMINSGILQDIVLHEMGHVMGIGILWEDLIDENTLQYTGTQGLNVWQNDWGCAGGPPIQDSDPGPGNDIGGHWQEACLQRELMTSTINIDGNGPNPLSRLTVAAIADMGYTVDLDAADQSYTGASTTCCNGPAPTPAIMEVEAAEAEDRNDVARDNAIAHGKEVLANTSRESAIELIGGGFDDNGLVFVGDKEITVYYYDTRGNIRDVHVTPWSV